MFASRISSVLGAKLGRRIKYVPPMQPIFRLLSTGQRVQGHCLTRGSQINNRPMKCSIIWRLNHSSGRVVPFILPDIGEGIKEVVIKSWLVKIGDSLKQFDPICEVESDKATATISSRFEGNVTAIHHKEGDIAQVGQALIDIQTNAAPTGGDGNSNPSKQQVPSSPSPSQVDVSPPKVPGSETDIVLALPSARRLAKESGLDLSQVVASGRKGQILKEDVMRHMQSAGEVVPKVGKQTEQVTQIAGQNVDRELVVPLTAIGKAMFKTMTISVQIPHFSYADDIDVTRILSSSNSRAAYRADVKISNFAIIIKMVSRALLAFPQLNASVDPSGEFLTQKNYHNIGVAVDTKMGLIVPNIKDVQNLTVEKVNTELIRLKELAYESKLGFNDLSGATMTLSNVGAIGGLFGVPVLVSPEILIGALGKARKVPYLNSKGGISERDMMQIVWSADHRVVDGATLSRFTNLLKTYIQEPDVALLSMV